MSSCRFRRARTKCASEGELRRRGFEARVLKKEVRLSPSL